MKKKFVAIYVTWIAFLFVAILGLILSINSETKTVLDRCITIGFFLIVFAVFVYATFKYKKLYRLINDIKDATERINIDYYNNGHQLLWDRYKIKNQLFKSDELNLLYVSYLGENYRLSESGENGAFADIEDYFNYKLIDSKVKKNVMNLIAGAMTGLGILGTFIGLSVGLQHFSTGSTQEISDSIAPLMDGIKVAFHTSIYGMILSLLFNAAYKNDLEYAYDVLDEFLDTFKIKVTPNPETGMTKMMVQYQKKQAEELSELATVMSEKMTEKMSEFLAPQFDRLNDTVYSFADVASRAQLEGVKSIVDTFVEEMNKSLGNRFKELAKVLDETCDWQRKTAADMEQVLNHVGAMTTNIERINELSEATIQRTSEYIEKVGTLQSMINEKMEVFDQRLADYEAVAERQTSYIETLVEYEKSITEASKIFSADMVKQVEILEGIEASITEHTVKNMDMLTAKAEESSKAIAEAARQQVESIVNISNSASDNLNKAAEELGRASGQLGTQLNESLKEAIDVVTHKSEESVIQISDVAKDQVKAISEIEEGISANAIKNMEILTSKSEESSKAIAEAARQQVESIINISNSASDNMNKAAEELGRASGQLGIQLNESIKEAIDAVAHTSETCSARIADAAKEQIKSIADMSYSASTDMNTAADGLNRAMAQMNNQMEQRIAKSFELFDNELSEIVSHLSGTISEVRETTGRVPKVVFEAYEGMKAGMSEMESNTKKMAETMERLRRKMDAMITLFNENE